MHKVKRQMKADEKQPEMYLPQSFIAHLAGDFRIPIIKRREPLRRAIPGPASPLVKTEPELREKVSLFSNKDPSDR
jgi:hypothetical protein